MTFASQSLGAFFSVGTVYKSGVLCYMDHRTEAGEESGPSLPVLSLLATAEVPLDCELRDQQRRRHPWFGAGVAGPWTPAAASLLLHLPLQPSVCSITPVVCLFSKVTCAGPKAVKSHWDTGRAACP